MGEVWSKNKPLTLTVGALIAVALFAFTLGVKITAYMGRQEKTLEAIQSSQEQQASRVVALREELQAVKINAEGIRANADRLKEMEHRMEALEAAVKAVKGLVDFHVGLRWNVVMMEEWVRQLREQLEAAGVMLELPDVRTIRARALVDDKVN